MTLPHVLSIPKRLLGWFKRLSRKKKVLVIIATIILLMIVSSIASGNKPPAYKTAKVQKSNVVQLVNETGTVVSNGRTDIFSPTNGIVDEVMATNGDVVKKGDILFKVTSSATEQERTQAYANYLAAKSTLDTANATLLSLQSGMFSDWDTYKNLAESDSYENSDGSPKNDQRSLPQYHVAEKNWLAAEKNFQKQQGVISQAQASVTSAYLAYQATLNATVKATVNGTVSNLANTAGSSVYAYTPTSATFPVLALATDTTTEVVVQLSETDIAKIRVGQKVTIDSGGTSEKLYKGIVGRVDSLGTEFQGVIRYNVYVEVLNPDSALRTGMTADTEIVTKEVTNALTVPNAAVKPYRGGKAVRIVDPKKKDPVYIPVRTGIKGDEKTEILSGVEEGTEVITALPNDQLKRPGLF